jgi:hypothetical protein
MNPTTHWAAAANGSVIALGAAQCETLFDFSCVVAASALRALPEYIRKSERKTRELLNRLYRKYILSSTVSKGGRLSSLVPCYTRVCLETAARDQVLHLEVITLAEEHDAPVDSAVGQMLISGGKSWTRMKRSLLNFWFDWSEGVLPFGFIAAGLNFANGKVL